MSFGGGSGDGGVVDEFQRKFVTKDELDEKRKQRQEEWEKVRKPEDPKEAPEEEIDCRSLFDKLEEQKVKKQEEYEEQWALKNQVKGLGDDEAEFLDFVSQRQDELDKERQKEDSTVLNEYRSAIAAENLEKVDANKKTESKSSRPVPPAKKTQQALLMGAVKRKSSSSDDKTKTESSPDKRMKTDTAEASSTLRATKSNSLAKVIGILPGLGAYDDSSDEKDTSSDSTSGDEEGLGLMAPRKVIVVQHQ